MGDRDSEVAVVIQGKKFASSLRHQIWSVALGINVFAFLQVKFRFIPIGNFFWISILNLRISRTNSKIKIQRKKNFRI